MRIVICDDHRLLVEVLATWIVRAGHTVEAVPCTPAGAVEAVERHRPDVLLLDLNFPEGDSLETARKLVMHQPQTKVVVLTGSDSLRPLRKALDIGVAGYLRKDERIDQMLVTLERCVAGEQVIDDRLMRRLAPTLRERPRGAVAAFELTARERDVAGLLIEGCNTAEMVVRLGISDSTVRTHVQSVLNKLCVHSRIEAVALLEGERRCAEEAVS